MKPPTISLASAHGPPWTWRRRPIMIGKGGKNTPVVAMFNDPYANVVTLMSPLLDLRLDITLRCR